MRELLKYFLSLLECKTTVENTAVLRFLYHPQSQCWGESVSDKISCYQDSSKSLEKWPKRPERTVCFLLMLVHTSHTAVAKIRKRCNMSLKAVRASVG